MQRKKHIEEKAQGQCVKSFVSDEWTLEYDLAHSGVAEEVYVAAYLARKEEVILEHNLSDEIVAAKSFAKKLGLKQHKIIDIGFMKELYGNSNVLTSSKRKIPSKFEYSIVVPIRNAVFLSIASAWAFTLNASLVVYGAHTGDKHYPDCRPSFAKKLESAFNQGEIDGIKKIFRFHHQR